MSSPETSVAKLLFALSAKETAELTIVVARILWGCWTGDAAPGNGYWQQQFLTAPSFRIAAGSDEVQRNIIGERVLGLPGDIRADKDVAFKDLVRCSRAASHGAKNRRTTPTGVYSCSPCVYDPPFGRRGTTARRPFG